MIRFFSKIRQNLLSRSKTRKYVKYAFGEIVLVVIGILIALQINNWNENRKDNLKEIGNLKSLKSELIVSLEELKSDCNSTKIFHESTLNIQSYLQKKPLLTDSMYKDFFLSYQFANFFPKTSTYETLKSGHLDLIQSDPLRILITDIYEAGYKRILAKVNTRRNASKVLFPYYQDHFRVISNLNDDIDKNSTNLTIPKSSISETITRRGMQIRDSYIAVPNDYDYLINDPKYETLISEAIIGRRIQIRDFEFTIELVEKGISEINDYLKTK